MRKQAKRFLALALAMVLCFAVPAMADGFEGANAGSGGGAAPGMNYAAGQPSDWTSPQAISYNSCPWLFGYQNGDLISFEWDGDDTVIYTVRDGSTVQIIPNPDFGGWMCNLFFSDQSGEYDYADEFSYYSAYGIEQPEMEPIAIQFDNGLVTPQGTRVVRNAYDFVTQAEWEDPEFGTMGRDFWFQIKVASAKAYPSTQLVEVDGKMIEFQCYALKDQSGNGTNYIKLRDLADILNGTTAQFEVGWNGNVTITTGQAYTPNGTEHNTPFSGERDYQGVDAETVIDGEYVGMAAFSLTDDQGGGYTYYKLRDLGDVLNFSVDWDGARGIIVIDTTQS